MTSYLNRGMAERAIKNMKTFYSSLESLYSGHGIVVTEDLGRRNMLMSSLQEKTFATELSTKYKSTYSNGKTGEPDIVIPEIGVELECKLTSKGSSGWGLQTDYSTLKKKGSLDYLYVLASREFDSFAVLHFKGLTIDDFHVPSPGSRQKARMKFKKAFEKCEVLCGDIIDNAQTMIDKYTQQLDNAAPNEVEVLSNKLDYWNNNSSYSFALEEI